MLDNAAMHHVHGCIGLGTNGSVNAVADLRFDRTRDAVPGHVVMPTKVGMTREEEGMLGAVRTPSKRRGGFPAPLSRRRKA